MAATRNNGTRDFDERLLRAQEGRVTEIERLNITHEERMRSIDSEVLRQRASLHYDGIWQARSNFDRRYAVSTREKAMLKMRQLSADRTTAADRLILQIAKEAAPRDSTINVSRGRHGWVLGIDFPMSSVTHGEHGTYTKHKTIDSLRREVLHLVAQVSYDMFHFCRDLDLDSIRIGCRHMIELVDERGVRQGEEDLVLYKVRIMQSHLEALRSDPFLNRYSTSDYFDTEIDEFDEIWIEGSTR